MKIVAVLNWKAGVLAMLCAVFPSAGMSLGEPLLAFNQWFESLFRVQVERPEAVGDALAFNRENLILQFSGNWAPANTDALYPHLASGTVKGLKQLSCEDIVLLRFDDWKSSVEKARELGSETPSDQRSTIRWPQPYGKWSSPAYAFSRKK